MPETPSTIDAETPTVQSHDQAPTTTDAEAPAPAQESAPAEAAAGFAAMALHPAVGAAVTDLGYETPSPIQDRTIPALLDGRDVIGLAQTGTGKTAAFALPTLSAMAELGRATDGPHALVLTPTRELAIQVAEAFTSYATHLSDFSVLPIYGGQAYGPQLAGLRRGAQIVVGTPGRLLDLAGQRMLDLSKIETMVLDEADRMLDLGFLPDVERLFSLTPEGRHTMLFSATMPGAIVSLARRFMSRPMHIRASEPDETKTQANIRHMVYRAHALDKDEVIGRILQAEGRGKTVIFTRTKRAASKLVEELRDRGFAAASVHGDMSQEARERAMVSFKTGKKDVLIATDVAARGIDVLDVTHVINHTIPEDEKAYLHRVGRTGRAGRTGIAVTFVDWEDMHKWSIIDRALDMNQPAPVETYSSSPHLFEDMGIPAGSKGRLIATPPAPKSSSSSRRERGDRSRSNERSQSNERSERPAREAKADGDAAPRRRRRRRRTSSSQNSAETSE